MKNDRGSSVASRWLDASGSTKWKHCSKGGWTRGSREMMGASGGPRHVGLLSAHLVGRNKYRSRHWPTGFGDALSVLVERARPVEWCRPRGEGRVG